jgi:predicted transcriptional regulator
MNNEDLVTLTADIVSAHVSNNNVPISDVPSLVQRVHEALASLGTAEAPAEEAKKTPAVSPRASVKPDYLVCLECGRKHRTLKRHLMTAHNLTPPQYRADYGLPATYPMAAPNYAEMRRDMAKKIGLGRKRGTPAPAAAAKPAKAAASKGAGNGRRRGAAKA